MITLIIIAVVLFFTCNAAVVVEHNMSEPFWKYKSWGLLFGVLFNLLMLLTGIVMLILMTSYEYLHEMANKKW